MHPTKPAHLGMGSSDAFIVGIVSILAVSFLIVSAGVPLTTKDITNPMINNAAFREDLILT